jgi:hypothetical protein
MLLETMGLDDFESLRLFLILKRNYNVYDFRYDFFLSFNLQLKSIMMISGQQFESEVLL